MSGTIDARLAELGIELPPANAPAGNYVPYVQTGNLLFVSGQIPIVDGKPGFIGRLGAEFGVDDGAAAARVCALALIAQAKDALGGDLDRISRRMNIIKLQVAQGTDDFQAVFLQGFKMGAAGDEADIVARRRQPGRARGRSLGL